MGKCYKYYEVAASEVCPLILCYRITATKGFELINPENCIFRYIKIWNVILLLTYGFYCEKLYY